MYRRLVLIFLFISILNAFNTNDDGDDSIKRIKRFLYKKKTATTKKSSSNTTSALITTTSSSISTDKYGKTPIKPACDTNNPCQNGGTCKSLPSGRHYCYCSEQYYGNKCEKKFKFTGYETNTKLKKDPCSSSPCRNFIKCIPSGKTYSCQCKPSYYGVNCDKRLSKHDNLNIFE